MITKEKDIHQRIYNFVIRGMKLIQHIPKTPEHVVIIKQLSRSLTSIGANDQEADGTTSVKDFIHVYTIVRKEAKETNYWLRIIADTNPKLEPRMKALLQENNELIKIVSAIIYNTKKKRF